MIHGRVRITNHRRTLCDAVVNHLAELVRGHFFRCSDEGALIWLYGPHFPQGEKGLRRLAGEFQEPFSRGRIARYLFRLPSRMPMCLQMMESMISSAPPPMDPSRVSR